MTVWPKHCTCNPGTFDNGWHEQRCDKCLQAEMEQWRKSMAKLPRIVRWLKDGAKGPIP